MKILRLFDDDNNLLKASVAHVYICNRQKLLNKNK